MNNRPNCFRTIWRYGRRRARIVQTIYQLLRIGEILNGAYHTVSSRFDL